MDKLSILPCRLNDIGSQRCWLGPELMSRNDIQLYDILSVQISNNCSCICHAWPRLDASGNEYIQFDATVVSSIDGQCSLPVDLVFNPGSKPPLIPVASLRRLTCSAIESMSLTVVISRRENLLVYRRSSVDLLESRIRLLLTAVIVTSEHHVLCSRMTLGQLYSWDRIIVHDLKTARSCSCGFVAPSTRIHIVKFVSKERYDQHSLRPIRLGGLDHEAELLKSIVLDSCKHSVQETLDTSSKNESMKGILLSGPSGCGKTFLVRHVAAECDAYLMQIDASVHGSRPGESELNLRSVFRQAADAAIEGPCILLLDDIDAICPRPREGGETLGRRMLAELLSVMDEFVSCTDGLIAVATTSKPSNIDPSLRRVGRFEKEIFLGIPDQSNRLDILHTIVSHEALADDVDYTYLASATPGYTGADLTSLVRLAAVGALHRLRTNASRLCISHADFVSALHIERPSSQRGSDVFITNIRPVTWDDIGGLEEVKKKLQQCIEWPLKYPEAFRCLGLRPPRGVLLYGPPGCAKTSLVRAAATSCHVNFLAVSGAQLYSPYLGEAEKKIAEVFHQARACAPSLLFIDEIDSVIGSRAASESSSGAGGAGVQQRVLSTLLNEMDGIGIHVDDLQCRSNSKIAEHCTSNTTLPAETERVIPVDNANVIVVAATNRIDMVDAALLRPGRMDHVIFVPCPDFQARLEILKVHSRKKPLVDVDLEDVARRTGGFTGADLENLCNEASLHAVNVDGFDCRQITREHFDAVLLRLKPSVSADDLLKCSYRRHQ